MSYNRKCYLWNMTTDYRWTSDIGNMEELMDFYNYVLKERHYDMILKLWFLYMKNEKNEIIQAFWN